MSVVLWASVSGRRAAPEVPRTAAAAELCVVLYVHSVTVVTAGQALASPIKYVKSPWYICSEK